MHSDQACNQLTGKTKIGTCGFGVACHAVEPFIGKTVTPDKYYFRLHGRSGWRYEYELGELKELATSLVKSKRGYVFFNNSKMTEDALKFCKLLGGREIG